MNISTFDKMELCEAVTNKLIEIASKQGKQLNESEVFSMVFDGDHCDLFDNLLDEL